jgi:hypothetical protein
MTRNTFFASLVNVFLVVLLDKRDYILREAKKMRRETGASLEDARNRLAELETQNPNATFEIDSCKAAPVVSDEDDCGDCSIFLADLTTLCEKLTLVTGIDGLS